MVLIGLLVSVALADEWSGKYVERGPSAAIQIELGPEAIAGEYVGKLTYRGNDLARGTFPIHATTCPKHPDCGRSDRLYVFSDAKETWGAMRSSRPLFVMTDSPQGLVARGGQLPTLPFARLLDERAPQSEGDDTPSGQYASPPTDWSAYAAPITAPWTGMGLPIGDGAVLYSDDQTITVTYADTALGGHADGYSAAILANGWTSTYRSDDNGMVIETFTRGGKTLTLAVMVALGATTVAISQI